MAGGSDTEGARGMKSILLVGEQNPHNGDARYALYPLPAHASGGRLARVLGLTAREYLQLTDRVNLCAEAWDEAEARLKALEILTTWPRNSGVVLLGRRAERVFGWVYPRYEVRRVEPGLFLLALPHPSGLCREWNDPANVDRARSAYRELSERVREVAV